MSQPHAEPAATVDGRLLQAVIDGVVQSCGYFETRARKLLADSGLDTHPEAGTSYSFDRFLDVLETVERTTGPNTLNRIGRAVPELVDWPVHVATVGDALQALNTRHVGYHSGDGAGTYHYTPVETTAGELESTTPYPAAFERGLLEGLGEIFGEESGYIGIEQRAGPKLDGSATKRFELHWWEDSREANNTIIPAPTETPSVSEASSSGQPVSGD